MSDAASTVQFRLARPGEDARLIAFINENFDMRLPLVNRPEFYEHYYKTRGEAPQFAVAEQDGELLSIAGYIAASADPQGDVWVSVWAAKKRRNGIGLELMNALPNLLGANVVACNNIRPKTCALYHFLGWTAERLPHFYRLASKDGCKLAVPDEKPILPVSGDLVLRPVESAAQLAALGMPETPHTPVKDVWYLAHRYLEYPHYAYQLWAVCAPDAPANAAPLAYLVTRLTPAFEHNGPEVPVLRVVDFVGRDQVLPRLGAALDRLLRQSGAEYADCYCAGIPAAVWAAAGFQERCEGDAAVIPTYLNPPLQKSIDYYYFTNHPEQFVLFKADGDQDRPNLS